jgi:hypothetical protein
MQNAIFNAAIARREERRAQKLLAEQEARHNEEKFYTQLLAYALYRGYLFPSLPVNDPNVKAWIVTINNILARSPPLLASLQNGLPEKKIRSALLVKGHVDMVNAIHAYAQDFAPTNECIDGQLWNRFFADRAPYAS